MEGHERGYAEIKVVNWKQKLRSSHVDFENRY